MAVRWSRWKEAATAAVQNVARSPSFMWRRLRLGAAADPIACSLASRLARRLPTGAVGTAGSAASLQRRGANRRLEGLGMRTRAGARRRCRGGDAGGCRQARRGGYSTAGRHWQAACGDTTRRCCCLASVLNNQHLTHGYLQRASGICNIHTLASVPGHGTHCTRRMQQCSQRCPDSLTCMRLLFYRPITSL